MAKKFKKKHRRKNIEKCQEKGNEMKKYHRKKS